MGSRRIGSTLAFLLLTQTLNAPAQRPEPAAKIPWQPRVRVTTPGPAGSQLVGHYLHTAGDTLWLQLGAGGPSPIPLER